MHPVLQEMIGFDRIVKAADPDPSTVVMQAVILRHTPNTSFEVLLTEERKGDALKSPGQISLAGAETAKAVGGRVEDVESTLLGALAEEILAGVPVDQRVRVDYADWGDFWYVPGVLAHLVSVRLDPSLPAEYIKAGDGETSNPWWASEESLAAIDNWRPGMEDSLPLIRALAAQDFINWQASEAGTTWRSLFVTGESLQQTMQSRSQLPDTKSVQFDWRL